eukprot:scaffold144908_cov56-Attheya_sp.AAC.6
MMVTSSHRSSIFSTTLSTNIACDHGASESALCEPSYDPHLSHSAITSSTSSTSKQCTSQVRTSDHAEICALEGSLESDTYILPNQDRESHPLNSGFSELPSEEELKYVEVAQNSTAHKQAAIHFALSKYRERKYPSWEESFKELLDFKKINGHTNVVSKSGPLGHWVNNQQLAFCLLKQGNYSTMTLERRKQLEKIGFLFKCPPTCPPCDQRFRDLVFFQKRNGHTNVPPGSRPLGRWVLEQQTQYLLFKEGKHSLLTNERREQLESIGFAFGNPKRPTWDQRFQELLDFKKVNGHTSVPTSSRPLGYWVRNQRQALRLLTDGKKSSLTNERREKLESIGFVFVCDYIKGPPWEQRFQELVDFKKVNGHTNVPQRLGPLGHWVYTQKRAFYLLEEGNDSPLIIDRREKLESIGFSFNHRYKKDIRSIQ